MSFTPNYESCSSVVVISYGHCKDCSFKGVKECPYYVKNENDKEGHCIYGCVGEAGDRNLIQRIGNRLIFQTHLFLDNP